MKNVIIQTADKEFNLVSRGNDFTLRFEPTYGKWAMYTVNAMVKAYNRGYATPKFFATLEEVESKYKAWRGIVALAA